MVLARLHFSLMGSPTCNPASSLLGSCTFISKTRYRGMRRHVSTYFPCSSFTYCGFYAKESQVPFKKIRLVSKMMGQTPGSFRPVLQNGSYSYRHPVDESMNRSSIRSMSVFGFTSPTVPFSTSSVRLLSNYIILYGAFAKRILCTKATPKPSPIVAKTSDPTFVKEGKDGGNLSKHFLSNKNRKRVKASATQGSIDSKPNKAILCQLTNKSNPYHRVSAQENANSFNSTATLVEDGQKESKSTKSPASPASCKVNDKPDSNTESKPKQKSRSKKKRRDISNTASSDAVPPKSPTGQPQAAENSSTGNTTNQEADLSHSTIKKKTSKHRRKGKPLKEVGAEENRNGALPKLEEDVKQAPSSSNSSRNPKPLTVNGIKSIKLKPLYPPVGKSVVIVESLTKAKVIQGYLGGMYEVLPSYGHVRDLCGRSGSVRPDDDFSMVWEVPSSAWTHLKSINVAVSGADSLILASDPDREGEAIAWHIIEMLQQQGALRKDLTVCRVVFQEITESAIKKALQTPRDINVNLVHAYLARRALDYLIGFNISPVLWRKLPGCQSAGRVQSAALSLLCDRELEIDEFKPQEYWSVEATFNFSDESSIVNNYCSLRSYLTHFNSKKLSQLSIGSEAEAKNIEQLVNSSQFKVSGVKRTKVNRNPPTPYITSTLQQDAANKLNFSASYTMNLAQKLYEGIQFPDGKAAGLITYMRTDGLHISDTAVKEICSLVTERYGPGFVATTPRKFFKKVKNAQEAHEAIRPTDIRRLPSMLAGALDEDSLKLYTLIWARTMACQMEAAKLQQIQLDIGIDGGSILFRSASSTVEFPGFRSVYEDVETRAIRLTENVPIDRDEIYKILSNLKQGDQLSLKNVELKEHHTQPPPRYSEATLVKKLEELGIGRPSTYASTIKVLRDRKYVIAKDRVLHPEFRGRMVSAFLSHYFTEVTDYSFTADMETELDNVSGGVTDWKGLLKDYWSRFSNYCDLAGKVPIHQVEKMLERTYGSFLFSALPDESRTCPSCLEGTLNFKVSKFGAGYFIGCDQHPRCKYIANTLYGEEDEDEAPQTDGTVEEPIVLGTHPVSGEKILLKGGPYGNYVQLGEDKKGHSPKRTSISQIKDIKSVTLEAALNFLRYPITLGNHPVDGRPVILRFAKGQYGIRHRRHFAKVPKGWKPEDMNMDKALLLLASENVKKCGRPTKKPEEEVIDDFCCH